MRIRFGVISMNRIFAAILATVFASSALGHGNDIVRWQKPDR